MKNRYSVYILFALLIAAVLTACSGDRGPKPDDFTYEELEFNIPKADEFRTVLSNGLVVYIAEDHEIPWFSASLMVRTGPFLEPANKLGIASMTQSIMRSGGTTSKTEEQINERMDFLAGSVSATSLSIHMKHLDEGMSIWMDILRNPRFPDDKIRQARERAITSIRNRNKNVSSVGSRTFSDLVYGEDSPITAQQTERMVNGIVRNDLVNWHRKYWGANNAILVVSGDFQKDEMLQKLEDTFGKWRDADKAVPNIPDVRQAAEAGVYMVEPEVIPNQGVIRIGHLGLMQDDPDYPAVDLMNYILGGGSFSSRIMRVVRSDHGLAYSTGARFSGGTLYPGTFTASCQTKNSTVVFAAQLMLNEIEKIRDEPISEEDLEFAKTARINAFPSQFSSISGILRNFANLEFNGRDKDYYDTYIEKYNSVTIEDISRVAKEYLQPENMIIMISGNIEECSAGANELLPNQPSINAMAEKYGGRTIEGLAKMFGDGTVHIVPLK
ncbi:M16 family metallopeptidase [candidate division KSB1 bacterium]